MNEESWEHISDEDKENIFKYLKLMKIFTNNSEKVSLENKKWMLKNCALSTELVPVELMGRFWL